MHSNLNEFSGCKLAYVFEGKLLVYRRDNKPDLIFPDMWDFPGGGREGREAPEECVLRELQEEFSIKIPASRLVYKMHLTNHLCTGMSYFFVASGRQTEIEQIVFGDEGQYWQLMDVDDFLKSADAIPMLKLRMLRLFRKY